ncbi:MAG: hypothetical protein Q8P41_09815 [Pseudomonadota bacterium]|nr:hypothetical protein [Pseudomonadota bacterium]
MSLWLVLLHGGCGTADRGTDSPVDSAPDTDSGDTNTDSGDTDSGDTDPDTAPPDDTAETSDPCDEPDDPERAMGWPDLLDRLQVEGCLSTADQDAAIAFVDTFYAEQDVWCDAAYRLSSPDGLSFSGTPELVREHASVSDVTIAADGAHVLVYNDLTPGLFAATVRGDPARFWREGLVGVGGLGLSTDSGAGFVEVPLDLHLPRLALVVDPDIALRPAGDYRIVTFAIAYEELDGVQWDPLAMGKPHDIYRAVSSDFRSFPAPVHVLASEIGQRGGSDPTVLDLPDGEILFLGDFTELLLGWYAPKGNYPAFGSMPDVLGGLPVSGPKAVDDPDGPYRLYYVHQANGSTWLATGEDGRAWTDVGLASDLPDVHSPSVARDPGGTWWMYFNRREPGCMAKARPQRP